MKIDDRMKRYEQPTRAFLTPRMPAILRVDGRSFHTYTKGFEKPFDIDVMKCMEAVAVALCKQVSTAKLAYGQSDEVSVLMVDYARHDTQQYFDGEVSKICSICASIATLAFNEQMEMCRMSYDIDDSRSALMRKKSMKAMFDARVFSVPKEDVANYFVWRRQDAVRNSISSLGQAHFSHKQMHGLKTPEIISKLQSEKSIDWHALHWRSKEGFYLCKNPQSGKGIEPWLIATPRADSHVWHPDLVNDLVNIESQE